jgi:hypothetical protein
LLGLRRTSVPRQITTGSSAGVIPSSSTGRSAPESSSRSNQRCGSLFRAATRAAVSLRVIATWSTALVSTLGQAQVRDRYLSADAPGMVGSKPQNGPLWRDNVTFSQDHAG